MFFIFIRNDACSPWRYQFVDFKKKLYKKIYVDLLRSLSSKTKFCRSPTGEHRRPDIAMSCSRGLPVFSVSGTRRTYSYALFGIFGWSPHFSFLIFFFDFLNSDLRLQSSETSILHSKERNSTAWFLNPNNYRRKEMTGICDERAIEQGKSD